MSIVSTFERKECKILDHIPSSRVFTLRATFNPKMVKMDFERNHKNHEILPKFALYAYIQSRKVSSVCIFPS